jgi:hypothetical protein
MQTPSTGSQAALQSGRRAVVTAIVHIGGVDRTVADQTTELARELARASAHGPVEVTDSHDAAATRLTLTVSGALPAVLRLLNGKTASGARLIEDDVLTSMAATVDGVGITKAVAIGDHLLNAAKNHPPGDPPLEIRTEHDEWRAQLDVTLKGSLFATSYLAFLVNLHLTQSRT